MLTDNELSNLKRLLEKEYQWPHEYLFKFIVPTDKLNQLKSMFPGVPVQKRESANGNFVSLSVNMRLESADLVIAIYQQASRIPGLLAL